MPLVPKEIIDAELDKPIEMDKAAKQSYGVSVDGTERQTFYGLSDRHAITLGLEKIYKNRTARVSKSDVDKEQPKRFFMSAGGPGSGKTRLIRDFEKTENTIFSNAVHVDPDEFLRDFKPYVDLTESLGKSDIGYTLAYTYWRWASIYMSNSVLNKLCDDGYDIFFGTTGTSPVVAKLYDNAKKEGYQTHAVICHAPENVRLESSAERFKNERRYTPEDDLKKKGNEMFPDTVMTHFQVADGFSLYWRDALGKAPVLAAETQGQNIVIHNQKALDAFCAEISKNNPDFSWQKVKSVHTAKYKGMGKKTFGQKNAM